MLDPLIGKHHLIEALWSAVNTSSGSLSDVAPLVKKVLMTEAWKERKIPQLGLEPVCFDSFPKFITDPPLRGCGWPLEKVEALIKDDVEVLALWRKATTAPHGGDHQSKSDNITLDDGRGTSRSYTVARLKCERPDLFKRVIDGELSANAAAIEAGFRRKLTSFEKIIRELPKLTDAERQQLRELLDA